MDDWFYVPTWERTPFPREIAHDPSLEDTFWLIVRGSIRRRGLHQEQDSTHCDDRLDSFALVKRFVSRGDGSFELNPAGIDDYLKLFRELEGEAAKAINIVHLGGLTRNDDGDRPVTRASNQNFGFYSLLHIAQAIGELNVSVPIKIGIVSNRIHEVTGEERLDPAMATVLGPCGVIPKEFPNVKCFNIDLPDNQAIENLPDEVFATILSEFAEPSQNRVVAYRGSYRWERRYNQVKLPKPCRRARNESAEIRASAAWRGLSDYRRNWWNRVGQSPNILPKTCQPRIVLTKKTPFRKNRSGGSC